MILSTRRKLGIILFPLSIVYGTIIRLRNWLFDVGFFKQQSFPFPVICIGNLTVGGTGKTPHTEYVIDFLQDQEPIAVLSRGYGRITKGFIKANDASSPHTIGDEPYQMFRKFSNVVFAVDEKRTRGLKLLKEAMPALKAVILDDAFQHRYVQPGLSILLIDYNRPIFNDYMLPFGDLRDNINQLHRADIVIITKVPEAITPIEKRIWIKNLNLYPYQQLFFSNFAYSKLFPVWDGAKKEVEPEIISDSGTHVLLVTGIANPGPLKSYLEKQNIKIHLLQFSDHHSYSIKDIEKIQTAFDSIKKRKKIIITTEKDAVKIRQINDIPRGLKEKMYYIGIKVKILEGRKTEFEKLIRKYVKKNTKISSLCC